LLIPLQDRIGLHSWTLDTTPLAEVLRIARETGYNAVELRHIDFKRCIEAGMSNEQVLAMIRASGVKVSCMGLESGTIFARGDEQRRLFDSMDQMCARAAALDCEVMMVAPGANLAGTVKEAARNFATGGGIAQKYGLRCALEFNSRHPVVSRLAVAREILALANQANCGLLIDTYHAQCAGDGGRAFEDVPASDIIAFQFSDVPPGPISHRGTALDRLPPGKGVVRWREVLQLLMEKGYDGYINYEAPNPAQWSRPPAEVAREGITLMKALLADAAAAARQKI
jgi:sugar phosphate isomerase/epimerase